MNIRDKVSLQLKNIWDNAEFYENIFFLFNSEDEISKLDEYLTQNDNLTSGDIFKKIFVIWISIKKSYNQKND